MRRFHSHKRLLRSKTCKLRSSTRKHVNTHQDQRFDACSASDLSNTDFEGLKVIFGDEKIARQVLNAAKRVSKKRKSSESSTSIPALSPKRAKPLYGQPLNPAEFEASLALPEPERDEAKLMAAVVYTNRAPLILAFAVTLLKYTMPDQPISSRLSLAQAVTSMNSKTKAIHVGLDYGRAAEDEGWGEGRPLIRIMTRDVRVMKRWGYDWEESASQSTLKSSKQETPASSSTTLVEDPIPKEESIRTQYEYSRQVLIEPAPNTHSTISAIVFDQGFRHAQRC
jgi:hypothetical protein